MQAYRWLILLAMVVTLGCVKEKTYPGGPAISFKAPEDRLAGKWKLTRYSANTVDSTAFYQGVMAPHYWYFITNPNSKKDVILMNGNNDNSEDYFPVSNVKFNKTKDSLYCDFCFYTLSKKPETKVSIALPNWYIVKLTSKQVILRQLNIDLAWLAEIQLDRP